MTSADKIKFVLNNFSNGQIQSQFNLQKPVKIYTENKNKTISSSIIMQDVKVKGTGIPASTIKEFKKYFDDPATGKVPRQKSIKKLSLFYDRFMYNYLQYSGASKTEAKRLYRHKKAFDKAINYQEAVKKIAERKNVSIEYILYGIRRSDMIEPDLDYYVNEVLTKNVVYYRS